MEPGKYQVRLHISQLLLIKFILFNRDFCCLKVDYTTWHAVHRNSLCERAIFYQIIAIDNVKEPWMSNEIVHDFEY